MYKIKIIYQCLSKQNYDIIYEGHFIPLPNNLLFKDWDKKKNEVCSCMFIAKFLVWFYTITGNDISKPLKNSFIHTGHGDPGGKSWGDPAAIDE